MLSNKTIGGGISAAPGTRGLSLIPQQTTNEKTNCIQLLFRLNFPAVAYTSQGVTQPAQFSIRFAGQEQP